MKKATVVTLILAIALMAVPAFAEDGAATYKAKCQMCHGADGKKMAKADLTKTAKSADEIAAFLTSDAKHKTKVDAAGAKAVAEHVKTLK